MQAADRQALARRNIRTALMVGLIVLASTAAFVVQVMSGHNP